MNQMEHPFSESLADYTADELDKRYAELMEVPIMLVVIWLRCLKGHFSPERHFAFEAVAWYWHFVDVVWLGLYLFVYWL